MNPKVRRNFNRPHLVQRSSGFLVLHHPRAPTFPQRTSLREPTVLFQQVLPHPFLGRQLPTLHSNAINDIVTYNSHEHLSGQSILLLSSSTPKSVLKRPPSGFYPLVLPLRMSLCLLCSHKSPSHSWEHEQCFPRQVPSPLTALVFLWKHCSLSVFPQNIKEQIKTLKWFWFNFTQSTTYITRQNISGLME